MGKIQKLEECGQRTDVIARNMVEEDGEVKVAGVMDGRRQKL